MAGDQRRIAAADRQHLCHPTVQQPPAGNDAGEDVLLAGMGAGER
jgi:hypothetical protein